MLISFEIYLYGENAVHGSDSDDVLSEAAIFQEESDSSIE
jgi:hypothetical protein